MINNILKCTFVLTTAVAFLLVGFVVYKQSIAIADLERAYKLGSNNSNRGSIPPPIPELDTLAPIKEQNNIGGVVKSISEGLFTVEAFVPDTTLFSKIDTSKPFTVPHIKKIYRVKITSGTIFENIKLVDIKVGDNVSVSSASPILETDNFEATKVVFVTFPVRAR